MNPLIFSNGHKNTYGLTDKNVFSAPALTDTPTSIAPLAQILTRSDIETLDLSMIAQVHLNQDKKFSVTFIAKKGGTGIFIDTHDANIQKQYVNAVLSVLPKTTQSTASSLRTELLGPIIFGAIIAGIGVLVFSVAQEMADGTYEPTRRYGKAWIISKIVNGLASVLGTTGTLLVFGALVALCTYWLIQAIRHRHTVTRWKVG